MGSLTERGGLRVTDDIQDTTHTLLFLIATMNGPVKSGDSVAQVGFSGGGGGCSTGTGVTMTVWSYVQTNEQSEGYLGVSVPVVKRNRAT